MFTLIKKTSVHKDTKVVSNQKYDAILGRIYTISHLLSLERHNRISKTSPFVKAFLEALFQRRFFRDAFTLYRYVYCVSTTGGYRQNHNKRAIIDRPYNYIFKCRRNFGKRNSAMH